VAANPLDNKASLSYAAAMQYIKECTKFGIKLGLERMNEILARLGHPERQFRAIHVAGTNGKGSTVAMFEAVLRAAGYKTGRFTSPHLVSYRERFVVDGVMITKDQLAAMITELQPVIATVTADGYGAPTEFEVGAALAFSYFARQQVAVAVIEVGMGGRFDATNVIEPALSVIAHIALDHQEYLGDTLEKIAFEKAGIIKPGVPVVIGVQEPEICAFLTQIADERGAAWAQAGDLGVTNLRIGESGTAFTVISPVFGELSVQLGLIGRHQVDNCRNVIAGAALLSRQGLPVSREQLLSGLAQVVWPGRLERMAGVAQPKLFFDGTHNPDGIRALVDTLKTLFPGQKIDFLFGKLANRPSAEMAAIMAEVARRVITTTVPYGKTTTAEDLAAVFQNCGVPAISEPDPAAALDLLLKTDNPIAVATGSFYLTGFLRAVLYHIED
jgi:dihydrofolate synthase/folylpolyglutamate synthase